MGWKRRRWVNGRSRSMNADIAEREGRMPLTHAVDAVYGNYNCRRHRITRKAVRELLERHWGGEWHHVGPYAYEVAYFDTGLSFGQLRLLLCTRRQTTSAA
jgi:hypothetical protein